MKGFIVYNQSGEILRTGSCPDSVFYLQAGNGEFVMEGLANDVTQKITNPGIAGKVMGKTPEEIKDDNPIPMPYKKRSACITNEQWQDVLKRLDKLKTRSIKTGE